MSAYDAAMTIAAEWFGVPPEMVLSRGATRSIVRARQAGWSALHSVLGWSCTEIGREHGYNHSTIMHGIARIDRTHAAAVAVIAERLSEQRTLGFARVPGRGDSDRAGQHAPPVGDSVSRGPRPLGADLYGEITGGDCGLVRGEESYDGAGRIKARKRILPRRRGEADAARDGEPVGAGLRIGPLGSGRERLMSILRVAGAKGH